MYEPSKIANYILSKWGNEKPITPMQLNKLVYISHGWYLAITDSALIDEQPEAWKYGPVIPSLYHKYKVYGNRAIPAPAEYENDLPAEVTQILDKVWAAYGKYDGLALSSKTHQPNTPWFKSWNERGKYQLSYEIPDDLIKAHYQELLLRNIKSK